jgi:tetratricopeptide (TPR) repeat protein
MIICLILISNLSYSQSKNAVWQKEYIKKADVFYRQGNYSKALIEYNNALKINIPNNYVKNRIDSCRYLNNKLQDEKELISQITYKNQLKSDSIENRHWRNQNYQKRMLLITS